MSSFKLTEFKLHSQAFPSKRSISDNNHLRTSCIDLLILNKCFYQYIFLHRLFVNIQARFMGRGSLSCKIIELSETVFTWNSTNMKKIKGSLT